MKLVRIVPFVKGAGTPLSYTLHGMKYREGKWYECDDPKLAAELRKLRVNDMDPRSRRIFEVVDPEEAVELEEAEQALTKQHTATQPAPAPVSRHKQPAKVKRKLQAERKVEQLAEFKPAARALPVEKEEARADEEAPEIDDEFERAAGDSEDWGLDSPELGPPVRGDDGADEE